METPDSRTHPSTFGISSRNSVRMSSIASAVDSFKSAIIRIRDILRGPGISITGMESMRHICLYLLARYMTRERVGKLGVPEEYCWENIIHYARHGRDGDLQTALDLFYVKDVEDCLVYHFDRLFGTEKFSFDVKHLNKHKEILNILDAIRMEDVDCHMDILGWVYEQHLGTGSSSASRDLGQFFTDRFICEYMTELCKPGFISPGVPESICDPAMGTGGFLTSYVKFYKTHHPEVAIDWSVQQQQIFGCDTDPRVAGVSRMNLFMELHGERCVNLLTHDSLYHDTPLTGFDIILANMPFGLKGIKHAECCERIKDLKIRGTKSEPLFLQLMMLSLNHQGRCAVVVPDGMLVNTSTLHDGTRRHLLENFELHRVIKMKGKFFMNTGIQPSILFFENTGKPTSKVEFWDVIKGDKGEITETMVASVPVEKMDSSYSLDMRRYMEEKYVENPSGFPMVKLGEIGFYKKYPQHDTSYGKTEGCCKFHTGGVSTRLYTDTPDIIDKVIIINRTNGAGKSNIFVDSKCSVAKQTLILSCVNEITTMYVYYWLSLNKSIIEKGYIGSNHKNLSSDFVKNIKMPLPPFHIQEEIVATLDRIYSPGTTELADTLKLTDRAMDLVLARPDGLTLEPIVEAQRLIRKSAQMVADVKAQMVAIVKASCVSGEEKPISEVVKLKYGFPFKSSDYTTEGLAVVKHNNITDGYVSKSKKQDYIPSSAQTDDYKMVMGDIVISMDFDCGKVGKIIEDNWVLNQRVCLARTTRSATLRQEYLYWLLRFGGFYEKMQSIHTGTTIKHISGKDIVKATLKVPHVSIQDSTLARLDALQSQLNSLESLQKQSEDNARFILESYLGASSSSVPEEIPEEESAEALHNERFTEEVCHSGSGDY
jgi:restriction endonuclease S subunit